MRNPTTQRRFLSARGASLCAIRRSPRVALALALGSIVFAFPSLTNSAVVGSAASSHVSVGLPKSAKADFTYSTSLNGSENLFLQVSSLGPTYSPAEVSQWLADICNTPTTGSRNLVLQDIVDSNGNLNTSYLDVIVPYLPGGSVSCFNKVFVGTFGPVWTGTGSIYTNGVEDTTFTTSYVNTSIQLANEFVKAYPQVQVNWYLTYEADLNQLYYPTVESAYASMLSSEMSGLSAIDPNAQFLWSPGFLYTYSGYSTNTLGMQGLDSELGQLFSSLKQVGPGLGTLDLQDEIGTTNCWGSGAMTPSDAVGWAHFLQGVSNAPQIDMNTTLFDTNCTTGGLVPITSSTALNTESYYLSQSVALGAAYEMRYWITESGYQLNQAATNPPTVLPATTTSSGTTTTASGTTTTSGTTTQPVHGHKKH